MAHEFAAVTVGPEGKRRCPCPSAERLAAVRSCQTESIEHARGPLGTLHPSQNSHSTPRFYDWVCGFSDLPKL